MAKPDAIRPGYYVALFMVPETAPCSSYIGLVQAADEYGIRINLVDWDNELDRIRRLTEDLFVPWFSITSMLVCTDEEPKMRFVRDKAPAWQADIESMITGQPVTKATKVPKRAKPSNKESVSS